MSYTSRIDLSKHVRKQACGLLQARLSDALDLEAQAKQAHWNVKGPHFLQLHQLFDAVHDAIDQAVTIGDADTADLFTQVSRETDKQLWFLEAHLQAH